MYFHQFGSFNKAADEATKFQFYVELVTGGTITSTAFPKEGYAAAIEALSNFHEARSPFLLWCGDKIVAIPYEQILDIQLLFAK